MNNTQGDLISRAELLEIAEQQGHVTVDDIINAEAVPPQVVCGRWDIFGCCSQCGYGDEKQSTQYIKENYKYCPNCGAKMGGEEDADR